MSLAHSAPMTLSDTSTGTPAAPNAAAMRALAAEGPHVPRSSHLDRDVDHGGNHLAPERGGEALRVVDAVLQREDDRIALEVWGERGAGALRIGRLHREEHQLRAARAARLRACVHRH